MLNPQTDDSTYGTVDPALALRPPVPAAQSTAALRPAVPAAQATAALTPRPAAAPIAQQDPLATYYQKVRQHESGGNDAASSGVAYGRYQFTPQTWLAVAIRHPELGLDKTNILDGAKQDEAMHALTQDNAAVLRQNGIEATPANLFMLHFLGEGAGPKFLRALQADPNAAAPALFPLETKYNPTIFHKPDGQPRTLAEVYGLMTKSFGGSAPDPGFKMEIAEGPATTMTDASSAPEPPPPPGSVPLTATAEEPPPPPGSVPIGGYQTDASGNLVVKPEEASPSLEQLMKEQIKPGTPTTEQEALAKGEGAAAEQTGRTMAGLGSGVGQFFTGLAEWDPTDPSQAAAQVSSQLKGIGSPEGQKLGAMLPLVVPLGETAETIGGAGKALYEGGSWVANALRGGWAGAKMGALGGASEATGELDPGKRLAEKIEETGKSTAVGTASGLAGAGGTAAVKGALWLGDKALGEFGSLGKTITGGYGREAERAAEELRTGVSAETGKAMSSADRAKREAALDQRAGERRLAGQEAEYQRAEASAQKIAADFAARPLATPAELGRKIHAAAAADMKELKDARTLESGYDAAVNADRGQPSVPTRQFLNRVSEAETRAKSTLMKSALSDLRDQLWTTTGGTRRTAVSTAGARRIIQDMDGKIDGLNAAGKTDEAHELEKMKDDFVEYLEGLKLDLKAAREKYAELSRPLDVYRDKGALAKPAASDLYSKEQVVDSTRIVGALLNGTESGADALARVVAKNPAMLEDVRGYFNKQLLEMAGEKGAPTPEQFGRFLNRNRIALERVGAVARTGEPITVAESGGVTLRLDKAYDEQNRYVLTDASGKKLATILASPGRDFRISSIWGEGKVGANSVGPSTMRSAAEAVKKMHPEVQTFSGTRTTGARNATGRPEAGGVEARVSFSPREVGSKSPLLEEFSKLKGDVGRSQEAVRTADEARTETQKSIQQLSKDRTAAETTRRDFKEFQSALDTVAPREAAATASSAIEKLHKSGYLTDAQLDDFNRQIRGVKDRYKDADEALHTLRYRIWPAVAAAAGAVGIGGVTEYFSHRIRP